MSLAPLISMFFLCVFPQIEVDKIVLIASNLPPPLVLFLDFVHTSAFYAHVSSDCLQDKM